MTDTIESLRAKIADYEQTMAILHDADQRAIKAWQAAHPGNDLVWPDGVVLKVWLMEERERLQAALDAITEKATLWEETAERLLKELIAKIKSQGTASDQLLLSKTLLSGINIIGHE